jgi:hypothetical protein
VKGTNGTNGTEGGVGELELRGVVLGMLVRRLEGLGVRELCLVAAGFVDLREVCDGGK